MRSQTPPPAYEDTENPFEAFQNPHLVAPSAPPAEAEHQGILNLSYDQIIKWWNQLSDNDRKNMLAKESTLQKNKKALKTLREDFKEYYPKEYYPAKVVTAGNLCASDYYVMYHFSDQMLGRYPQWFTQDIYDAFQVKPPAFDDLPQPPTYEEAMGWFNRLPQQDRDRMMNNPVPPEQIRIIRMEFQPYYRYYRPLQYTPATIYVSAFDPYDYYLMYRYPSYWRYRHCSALDFLLYEEALYLRARAAIELGQLAFHAAMGLGQAVGQGVIYTGHAIGAIIRGTPGFFGGIIDFLGTTGANALNGNDNKIERKNAGEVLLGLFIIVGALIVISSAFVSAVYATIKTASSLSDLFHLNKVGRSLWRLGCTLAAGAGGAIGGISLGAYVGSIVPGIGTAAGAIIGAIACGCLAAGLGAAFGKATAQMHDAQTQPAGNPNPISTTNSKKWDVAEIENALAPVQMGHHEIVLMLQTLKAEKNQYKNFTGSIAGTETHQKKHQYNKFLEAIKMGKDPRQFVRVDSHVLFKWNTATKTIDRMEEELAIPTGIKAKR